MCVWEMCPKEVAADLTIEKTDAFGKLTDYLMSKKVTHYVMLIMRNKVVQENSFL